MPLGIAGDGTVHPEVGLHGTFGDDSISVFRAGIKTEFATGKVEVCSAFSMTENRILWSDAGIELDPGFNGEGTLEIDLMVDPISGVSSESDDRL